MLCRGTTGTFLLMMGNETIHFRLAFSSSLHYLSLHGKVFIFNVFGCYPYASDSDVNCQSRLDISPQNRISKIKPHIPTQCHSSAFSVDVVYCFPFLHMAALYFLGFVSKIERPLMTFYFTVLVELTFKP